MSKSSSPFAYISEAAEPIKKSVGLTLSEVIKTLQEIVNGDPTNADLPVYRQDGYGWDVPVKNVYVKLEKVVVIE